MRPTHSVGVNRVMKRFGSKVGVLAMTRTSPFEGSSATTAPSLSPSSFSASAWSSASIERTTSAPGVGAWAASSFRFRPRLSTISMSAPSSPVSRSSYWRSMPARPPRSPSLRLRPGLSRISSGVRSWR